MKPQPFRRRDAEVVRRFLQARRGWRPPPRLKKPHVRQRAIDYFRRQADFCAGLGGTYVLFDAAAVGRPVAYDDSELLRAADALRVVADHFTKVGVRMADTSRRALGAGLLDLDVVLMALDAVGDHADPVRGWCTPGPLGAGGDPYRAMHGTPDPAALDALVGPTAATFLERERQILAAGDDGLLAADGLDEEALV